METNHGIEHEKNLNQGETPKQIEDSKKLYTAGLIIIIILTIVLFIKNLSGDF